MGGIAMSFGNIYAVSACQFLFLHSALHSLHIYARGAYLSISASNMPFIGETSALYSR